MRAGVSTCYDLRFPELYRAQLDLGGLGLPAVLVLAGGSGRALVAARAGPGGREPVFRHRVQHRRRARRVRMGGRSQVVAPDGTVLGEAGEAEEVLVVDLDVAQVAAWRAAFPVLADRRLSTPLQRHTFRTVLKVCLCRKVGLSPGGGLTLRAMVYSEYGALPTLQEVPEPHCPADGVVVAVEATGVCRSDWHAWMGHDPVALPHVPGHELAGTIAEVGPDVTRWRVGDRVTVPFACGCGTCLVCRAGNSQVCPNQTQPGFTHWGSFADRVALHAADSNLIALPDTVSAVDAAALGCRFATAFGALVGRGRLASGEWLVVHGVGGVGLSAVMIGMALGARVVAVDVSPAALDQAGELGAEVVIRTTDKDDPTLVARQVIDATEGGAHVTIDAFGSTATALASIGGLRQRGRHVQVGLLSPPTRSCRSPWVRWWRVSRDPRIARPRGRRLPPMMDLLASGALDPGRLVGQVIGLDEAGRALAELGSPGRPPGLTVVRLR